MVNYINQAVNNTTSCINDFFACTEQALAFGSTPRGNVDIAVKAAAISTYILAGPQMRIVTLVAYFTLSILYARLERLLSDPNTINIGNLAKLLGFLSVFNKVKNNTTLVEKLANFLPIKKSALHWFLGVPKEEAGTFSDKEVTEKSKKPVQTPKEEEAPLPATKEPLAETAKEIPSKEDEDQLVQAEWKKYYAPPESSDAASDEIFEDAWMQAKEAKLQEAKLEEAWDEVRQQEWNELYAPSSEIEKLEKVWDQALEANAFLDELLGSLDFSTKAKPSTYSSL